MENTKNPLAQHFRQPELYVRLPSSGHFWPNGSIKPTETGEYPVFSMTVKDEMTLKNPDALLSGQAVVDVISSCCPNIRDAWHTPGTDIDTILIGIRIASYGNEMDIKSKCPHCGEDNEHTVNLSKLMDQIPSPVYNEPKEINGLVYNFKPQNYKQISQLKTLSFEQQKLVNNVVRNNTLSELEKTSMFNTAFAKIRQLNLAAVVDSIQSITMADGTEVTTRNHISEFIDNSGRQLYEELKDYITYLNGRFAIPPMELTCENEECKKNYSSDMDFDSSSFFG